MDFITRFFRKRRQKRTFQEYGFEIDSFNIQGIGTVQYAHWLHPANQRISLSASDIEFLKQLVTPGGMAIDIGGYVGDTAIPMALAVGKEGLVLALEPNPYVYKILEKNASLNPELTHIDPLNFAATDEDGTFTFNYSDASFCNGGFLSQLETGRHGHNYELKVQGKNLEAFLNANYSDKLQQLQLIKVDAEGYDKEIIRGLSNLLKTYKPAIIAECYKRLSKEEREEFYDLLDGLGYDICLLDEFKATGTKLKIERAQMSDRKHFDILAIPR